jgi:hypothetical protein
MEGVMVGVNVFEGVTVTVGDTVGVIVNVGVLVNVGEGRIGVNGSNPTVLWILKDSPFTTCRILEDIYFYL